MDSPIDRIRQAITCPEAAVRQAALKYYTDSYARDPSVMPLVIEAAETYAPASTEQMLHTASELPQTSETLRWTIHRLRRQPPPQSAAEKRYCDTLSLILLKANPELLLPLHKQIAALPTMPARLRRPLEDSLQMHFWSWPQLWTALEQVGVDAVHSGSPADADPWRPWCVVRAMTRHGDIAADKALALLKRRWPGMGRDLWRWLRLQAVRLAGLLRLREAIPLLLKRLDGEDLDLADAIIQALVRIGGNAVVRAAAGQWGRSGESARLFLAGLFGHVHTDLALRYGLRLLRQAEDGHLQLVLAHGALSQFSRDAIDPVRQLAVGRADDDADAERWELRFGLVKVATIMGWTFEEYDRWHREAIARQYGEVGDAEYEEMMRLAGLLTEHDRRGTD